MRDPKALPDWVELDYHTRHRNLHRWRGAVTKWVSVVLVVVMAGSIIANVKWHRTATVYQSAPLAPAHAIVQNDCGRCHTEAFRTARRFSPFHSGIETVPDGACSACHDGPAHNAVLIEEPHCSECHREHRGRTVLAQVPDLNCTGCHADLKARHKDPAKCRFDNVSGFPKGHPEFALWRGTDPAFPKSKDPGRLLFNHKLHLDSQGVFVPDRGHPDAKRREVLDCAACHQQDDAGRYMKPINHEAHCARCHEGQRGFRLAGHFVGAGLQRAADAFDAEPAPHLPPRDIRNRVRGRLLDFFDKYRLDAAPVALLDRPWPQPQGELVWQSLLDRPVPATASGRFVEPQIAHMERMLCDRPGGCRYCHFMDSDKHEPSALLDKPRPVEKLPQVLAPDLPPRWFTHATFNHQHHRSLTCAECHAGATESTETADVLMPNLDVCARCHSPAGGARFDCAECHKYHDRTDHVEKARVHAIKDLLGK
jgi:hypothetical protein